MRIKIKYSKNTGKVPAHAQSILNSYIHTCLGRNNKYHDAHRKNYSISSLYGGKLNKEDLTLEFQNGGYFIVTSKNHEFINDLLKGVVKDENKCLTAGMKFDGIEFIEEKFYDGWNHFRTLSPFIIRRKDGESKSKWVTLKDDDFVDKVKEHMMLKISAINPKLDLSNFKLEIPKRETHKVKPVIVKDIRSDANQCCFSVYCSKEVAEILYVYGIGKSTGSGFGTIYKAENIKQYMNH